jgi:hypothetical protein
MRPEEGSETSTVNPAGPGRVTRQDPPADQTGVLKWLPGLYMLRH